MDNTVYIDLDTFEITVSSETNIHCDREIAPILVELLQKGYQTKASCAGHNNSGNLMKTLEPLENYDEWIELYGEHPLVRKVEMYDEKKFIHMEEESSTYVYIVFASEYDFESIPEGFKLSKSANSISVGKIISFFEDDSFTNRKKQIEIDKEIDETRRVLLTWTRNLKPVNEKGMRL